MHNHKKHFHILENVKKHSGECEKAVRIFLCGFASELHIRLMGLSSKLVASNLKLDLSAYSLVLR